jgi:hypothetical protein
VHVDTVALRPAAPGRSAPAHEPLQVITSTDMPQLPYISIIRTRTFGVLHQTTDLTARKPRSVHFGRADEIVARRSTVLNTARASHPERFVGGMPEPKPVPDGRLDQSSTIIHFYTESCSLIDSHECPIGVDRFRFRIGCQMCG